MQQSLIPAMSYECSHVLQLSNSNKHVAVFVFCSYNNLINI